MTKTIAYLRVSTEEQATSGVSLEVQRARCEAYAGLYDLELTEVIIDAGVSAKTLKRPGLTRALELLKRGEVSALLVMKLDRLTRSVRDLATLLDLFTDGRRALLSVGEQIDTRSASGRMVLNVLTSIAQWEREAIGERTKAALDHMRDLGQRTTGAIPYGMKLGPDNYLMTDVTEQQVIVSAQKLRALGLSLRAIGASLSEEGHLSRAGTPFTPSAVSKMLVPRTKSE
jgi:site-specific DNA recombinase